jgi:hypothetical protein
MEQYLRQGLKPDSKVLDIRQVDVSTGRFLEDNTPVFVITFTTQEVLLFRDRKTREVLVGAEDRVEQCNYAAVVTRVEEELENELTGGWKVIEVSIFFSSSEIGLMMVSESRWRVDRVAHIYDLARSPMSFNWAVRLRHQPLPPLVRRRPKKSTFVLIPYRFAASTHAALFPSLHYYDLHHHHSGNMYTHILIRAIITLDLAQH